MDDGVGSGLLAGQPWVPASERTCVLPMVGLSWNEASMERGLDEAAKGWPWW